MIQSGTGIGLGITGLTHREQNDNAIVTQEFNIESSNIKKLSILSNKFQWLQKYKRFSEVGC